MILAAPTIPFILVPGIALALSRFVCMFRLPLNRAAIGFVYLIAIVLPSVGGVRLESKVCRSLILSGGPSRL
jgi:hypothetical protein